MEHNKALAMTALALALSTGIANAHEIPLPTSGDSYILTEPTINWVNGVGTSMNNLIGDNTLAAYHFDVTAAGSVDAYTNDHDDVIGSAATFIYQKDAVGTDWTLVQYSVQGERSSDTAANNIFGVHITEHNPAAPYKTGSSDSGVRAYFDVGSYVAFAVATGGAVTGRSPNDVVIDPTGAKLSDGFSWTWMTGNSAEVFTGLKGLSDFTIKASPGSSAMVGAPVEPAPVPVPGAVWLMGTVLAGFTAFGRKKAVAA